MKKIGIAVLLCLSFASAFRVCGQFLDGDSANGTYTNPLISADFPDPDVIRVGDYYYMVTTTMFVFPGVTILKSHDLVNWEYSSNAIQRFDVNKCYNLDSCNRYGRGQWATSLKYHKGKFYLLFITLDEGGFMCTADNAQGPWKVTHLAKGYYDAGLFFDDDGKVYVAHGYSNISITEVDSNLAPVRRDSLVFAGNLRKGLEGAHVYKIKGYYYLYCTYGGRDGIQVALRSKSIYGPYEQRIAIYDTTQKLNYGIHQGALIETQTGEWWTILFVDSGPFGRFPSLQPVTWTGGFPMVGVNGRAVVTHKKPNVGKIYPSIDLPTSDEFNDIPLGKQWGWNHNPDSSRWSLKTKPGFLRLMTSGISGDLLMARNTITQRPFAKRDQHIPTIATTKIDISHMKEGDIAGMAVFQMPYAYVGVKQNAATRHILMVNDGEIIDSATINQSVVYFKTIASNASGKASFQYSLDNKTYMSIGNELAMLFNLKMFTGNKFCLFNYATKVSGGVVDIDWFRVD